MPLAAVSSSRVSPPRPTVAVLNGVSNVPPSWRPSLQVGLGWDSDAPAVQLTAQPGTLAGCQAACLAYRNTAISNLSGWSLCQTFTWAEPHGEGPASCVAVVDPMYWRPHPTSDGEVVTGRLHWPPSSCRSTADCSYNGRCSAQQLCMCVQGWKGDRCQALDLQKTNRTSGLRAVDDGQNTSTWGGAVLRDNMTGLYHMWCVLYQSRASCYICSVLVNSEAAYCVLRVTLTR